MNVTSELLSRYVDGEVTAEEAAAVEAAILSDEILAAELADFCALNELFGEVSPEACSDEFRSKLYALGQVQPVETFEPVASVPVGGIRRRNWMNWAAAAAILVLAIVGIRSLTHRPDIVLQNVTRLTLNGKGEIVGSHRFPELRRRSGDAIVTSDRERLSFRTPDGAMVVLQPGARLALGDPRDFELFEMQQGTVLCTIPDQDKPLTVRAGGFVLHTGRADFGVRVQGGAARSAGPSQNGVRVTVTVSQGSLEVENGGHTEIGAYESVVLRHGYPVERAHASTDPMYVALMRRFRELSDEILPGYFRGERGVTVIAQHKWGHDRGTLTYAVSDPAELSPHTRYLVLRVRSSEETPLRLTRLRPFSDAPGFAEEVTVVTAPAKTGWTILSVPLSEFDRANARKRQMPASRRQLVRFELRPEAPSAKIEIRTSLWAERPPSVDAHPVDAPLGNAPPVDEEKIR